MTSYAVVGGGIAGLAAAFELRRLAPGADITVYEASGRFGGKLRTTSFAGRPVDEGADAFLARVPWGRELAVELGLGDTLVSPARGNAYVAHGDGLVPIPEGTVLGVPLDPAPLRRSPLVSTDAAERVAAEPSLPGTTLAAGDDISVGRLIRRRFGDEVLERLVDPLLGGINAGDSDRLSLRAAAPQLAAAAERSPSIITGLLAERATAPVDPEAPVFHGLPGGMESLVTRLVEVLRAADVHLLMSTPVDDMRALGADGIVITTPAATTAALLRAAGAITAADLLHALGHASVVLVTFAFAPGGIAHALDASGFLVPRPEGRLLTACSFASSKWAHLAEPSSAVVLRASAGRYGDDRAIAMDDDALLSHLLADLDALVGVNGDPAEVRISRWPLGFPQYEPGHLDRVAAIESDVEARLPGVALAGASYRGIGVPACIRQGREAARRLV